MSEDSSTATAGAFTITLGRFAGLTEQSGGSLVAWSFVADVGRRSWPRAFLPSSSSSTRLRRLRLATGRVRNAGEPTTTASLRFGQSFTRASGAPMQSTINSTSSASSGGLDERRFHEAPCEELPDGTFVLSDGKPCLVLGARLLPWSPAGYFTQLPRPTNGLATVITPPSLVAVLRRGRSPVVPFLHPTASHESHATR